MRLTLSVFVLTAVLAAQTVAPSQSPRQALEEMFFARDFATIEKHLLESVSSKLRQLPIQDREEFLMALSDRFHGAWRLGWIGASVQKIDADTYRWREGLDSYEVHLDKDQVAGNEATVPMELKVFEDDEEVKSPGPRRLMVKMQLENGIWKLKSSDLTIRISFDYRLMLETVTDGRVSANESSVVNSLRTINMSEVSYSFSYPTVGFSPDLKSLGNDGQDPCHATVGHACLIDDMLTNATSPAHAKSGYYFTYTAGSERPILTYTITAQPAELGTTGKRVFCTDESGVIKVIPAGPGKDCLKDGKHI